MIVGAHDDAVVVGNFTWIGWQPHAIMAQRSDWGMLFAVCSARNCPTLTAPLSDMGVISKKSPDEHSSGKIVELDIWSFELRH